MRNRLITRFCLKKDIIYLRLTINGERAEISTNKKTCPSLWSKSLQKVTGKDEKACLINASLSTLEKPVPLTIVSWNKLTTKTGVKCLLYSYIC
jgi:hypothetical protein